MSSHESNSSSVRPPYEEDTSGEAELCQFRGDFGLGSFEEGQEANVPRHGFRPTPEEVEKHNATHIPFRNWCPYCVAGKAKTEPHKQSELCKPDGVNVVSMDYAFMGEKGSGSAEDDDGDVVEIQVEGEFEME